MKHQLKKLVSLYTLLVVYTMKIIIFPPTAWDCLFGVALVAAALIKTHIDREVVLEDTKLKKEIEELKGKVNGLILKSGFMK